MSQIPPRAKVLVLFVGVMAVAQILLEDILLFFGTAGTGVPAVLDSPIVLVTVPLAFSLLLLGVLLAAALRSQGGFR